MSKGRRDGGSIAKLVLGAVGPTGLIAIWGSHGIVLNWKALPSVSLLLPAVHLCAPGKELLRDRRDAADRGQTEYSNGRYSHVATLRLLLLMTCIGETVGKSPVEKPL